MRFLLAILLGLAAAPAFAERFALRAGEHPGFSRLVLDGAADASLMIGASPDGYEIRADDPEVEFALGSALARLKSGRIADLTQVGSSLFIELGCDCHIEKVVMPDGRLVLDISDGPPRADSPFETPLETVVAADESAVDPLPGLPATATEVAAESAVPPVDDIDIAEFLPLAAAGETAAPPWFAPPPAAESAEVLPENDAAETATVDAPKPGSERDLAEFERALAETLARAGGQGLVEVRAPTESLGHGDGTETAIDPEAEADEADLAEHAETVAAEAQGATAETSIDRESGKSGDLSAQINPKTACALAAKLDFLESDVEGDPWSEYGKLLADAFTEPGTPSTEGGMALVQFLLRMTFGAEAARVTKSLEIDESERMLLIALADIMDGKPVSDPVSLAALSHCSVLAGLVAFLAAGHEVPMAEGVDDGTIVRALARLPERLQRHLGPMAIEHLLGLGHEDGAAKVVEMIDRSDASASHKSVDEAEADLNLGHGESPITEAEAIVDRATPDQADAYVALTHARTKDGQEPKPGEIETLEALAKDQPEDGAGGELLVLAMERRLLVGAYIDVISGVADDPARADVAEFRSVEERAWAALIEYGSDLDLILASRKWPDRPASLGVAGPILARQEERLARLGFVAETGTEAPIVAAAESPPVVDPLTLPDLMPQVAPASLAEMDAILGDIASEQVEIEKLLGKAP